MFSPVVNETCKNVHPKNCQTRNLPADVLEVTDVRNTAPCLYRERRLWREKRRLSNVWLLV